MDFNCTWVDRDCIDCLVFDSVFVKLYNGSNCCLELEGLSLLDGDIIRVTSKTSDCPAVVPAATTTTTVSPISPAEDKYMGASLFLTILAGAMIMALLFIVWKLVTMGFVTISSYWPSEFPIIRPRSPRVVGPFNRGRRISESSPVSFTASEEAVSIIRDNPIAREMQPLLYGSSMGTTTGGRRAHSTTVYSHSNPVYESAFPKLEITGKSNSEDRLIDPTNNCSSPTSSNDDDMHAGAAALNATPTSVPRSELLINNEVQRKGRKGLGDTTIATTYTTTDDLALSVFKQCGGQGRLTKNKVTKNTVETQEWLEMIPKQNV